MRILGAVLTTIFAATMAHALDVVIEPVKNSTAMDMTVSGQISASANDVVAVLCDYGRYYEFTDTIRASGIFGKADLEKIIKDPFGDVAEAKEYIENGSVAGNCPGSTILLEVQDMPFPLSDTWTLNIYSAKRVNEEFIIEFNSAVASHKGSRGSYRIKPLKNGATSLVMRMNYDLGFRLPEFLLKFASKTMMPEMFKGIEAKAIRIASGKTDVVVKKWLPGSGSEAASIDVTAPTR